MTSTTTLGGRIDHYPQQNVTANDGDVVLRTGDVRGASAITVGCQTGAMAAFASLDGENFGDDPIAIEDLHETVLADAYVTETAGNRMYGVRTLFRAVELRQAGATPVTGAILLAGWAGVTR